MRGLGIGNITLITESFVNRYTIFSPNDLFRKLKNSWMSFGLQTRVHKKKNKNPRTMSHFQSKMYKKKHWSLDYFLIGTIHSKYFSTISMMNFSKWSPKCQIFFCMILVQKWDTVLRIWLNCFLWLIMTTS